MRIGLFTDTYLPDINGVVSSVELLRKKLVEHGHKCYVICTYPSNLFSNSTVRREDIIRLPGLELKFLYGYAVTSPFHFKVIEDIKNLNLDLIHVHTEFGVGIFARTVSKKLNIPLISTYHTTYEDYTHYLNPINSSLIEKGAKKVVAKLSKIYSNSCERIISPSEKTKNMLVNYKIKEDIIEVIPTGLEIERFKKENINPEILKKLQDEINIDKKNKIFIFVGRIAKEKSLDIVIKAMKKMKDLNKDVKLLVVGDGPSKKELMDLCSKLDVTDYVYFLGKKPNEDIQYYYHLADVFVSAATTETQGMTYIEALASGLLIVGRRDEVLTDLIDENETGFYFDGVDDLADIIDKIEGLEKNFLVEKRNKCISKSLKYDAEVFYEKIYALYKKVVDEFLNYYIVKDIKVKNNVVNLELDSSSKEKIKLMMSLDDYYEEGIRKKMKISNAKLLQYQQKELKTKCYEFCLKKLILKDYTIKQMYDLIVKNFDLEISELNDVIEKLESKQLLNDDKYALSKVNHYKNLFFSKEKIRRILMKQCINPEIIEKSLELYNNDFEKEAAYKIALKTQNKIKDKTVNAKINLIKQKLYNEGFDCETINDAIEKLDFCNEELFKTDLIKKIASKAKKRYEKKYKGSELRNRLFRYLFSQGFEVSDIYVVLDEMEYKDE